MLLAGFFSCAVDAAAALAACKTDYPVAINTGACVALANPCSSNGAWLPGDRFEWVTPNDLYSLSAKQNSGETTRQLCAVRPCPLPPSLRLIFTAASA